MIEILEESQGNVLAVKGHEKLTPADYDAHLIPSLEGIKKEHRSARLLFDMSTRSGDGRLALHGATQSTGSRIETDSKRWPPYAGLSGCTGE